jgi:hypothetical protein
MEPHSEITRIGNGETGRKPSETGSGGVIEECNLASNN